MVVLRVSDYKLSPLGTCGHCANGKYCTGGRTLHHGDWIFDTKKRNGYRGGPTVGARRVVGRGYEVILPQSCHWFQHEYWPFCYPRPYFTHVDVTWRQYRVSSFRSYFVAIVGISFLFVRTLYSTKWLGELWRFLSGNIDEIYFSPLIRDNNLILFVWSPPRKLSIMFLY